MREVKVTKNIITKETIKSELLLKNNKSIRFHSICFIALTFFVGIIFWAVYSFGLKNNEISALGWVVYFASMLICSFPSLFSMLLMSASLSERKSLKNGKFFVVTDEVGYKEEKSITRGGHVYVEKTIHFQKYGDVCVDSTCYQITSNADIFYMVVYAQNPQTPQKYYPAKLYEYKE